MYTLKMFTGAKVDQINWTDSRDIIRDIISVFLSPIIPCVFFPKENRLKLLLSTRNARLNAALKKLGDYIILGGKDYFSRKHSITLIVEAIYGSFSWVSDNETETKLLTLEGELVNIEAIYIKNELYSLDNFLMIAERSLPV